MEIQKEDGAPTPDVDPTTLHSTPEALAKDDSLSLQRRRALLEQWALDARARARATSENMDGGPEPMLDRVLRALGHVRERQ
ncbi:MAG: hypothetical protein H6704_12050 [Myxococcales bacterium]|nr:hypothetical protein [Myxococcales bacterium]